MKRRAIPVKILCLLLAAAALWGVAVLPSCSARNAETKLYSDLSDLDGVTVGVLTGTIFDRIASDLLPSSRIAYFNAQTDIAVALNEDKIGAYITDEPLARYAQLTYQNQTIFKMVSEDEYGFILQKGNRRSENLCAQLNRFLADSRKNGLLDEIDAKWFGTDSSVKTVDYSALTDTSSETLVFATCSELGAPFCYIKDGTMVGYDVDLAVEFCKAYGYGIEIMDIAFSALMNGVQSGIADFAGACITITEERRESVLFTDPNYTGGTVVVVKETNIDDVASVDDLQGSNIGVLTGSLFDRIAEEKISDCTVNYFNSYADIPAALDRGKISAYILDEPIARYILSTHQNQKILTKLSEDEYAFVFKKGSSSGSALRGQMNVFLQECRENGLLERLNQKWINGKDANPTIDYSVLDDNRNGVLTFATSTEVGAPFAYYADGSFTGYDIELAVLFCEKYGYTLEINNYSFSGMLSAVQSGLADFAGACIIVTEERRESVLFADTHYTGGTVIVVKKNSPDAVTSISDLFGETVGVVTGSVYDTIAEQYIRECKVQYYYALSDLPLALNQGKIKGYILDEPMAKYIASSYPNHRVLQQLTADKYGIVFKKNNEKSAVLCEQMDAFISESRENGLLAELEDKWINGGEDEPTIDYGKVESGTGTELVFATSSEIGAPFGYLKDGRMAGFDVEFAVRFCEHYGYRLRVEDFSAAGILQVIESGIADFGGCCITITEERSESVLFSLPYYEGGTVVVVSDTVSAFDTESFFGMLSSGFEKTFLRENRWLLFLTGIGNTMLITVLSILFGTLLGFALFMLCRKGNRVAKWVTKLCFAVIQGMPVVVLLMILYYLILGKTGMSGVAVSVVGFGIRNAENRRRRH